MTTIATFIDQAWKDHDANGPEGVAARLNEGIPLLDESPDRLGDFLQLAEHIHLGHFGNTGAMQDVLDRTAPMLARQSDATPWADRAILAMALLRGETGGDITLPTPARIRAHGAAVCGFIARGEFARARRLLQSAASIARDAEVAIRTDATKALAAGYNNAATQLLDLPRSPEADALMLETAALSRSTWGAVGTWLNAERAEYLLALCASATGDGARAAEHAQACASICETNRADAFERFFAHEAMAKALLEQGERQGAVKQAQDMQALLADIADEGKRAHASGVLDKLRVVSKL